MPDLVLDYHRLKTPIDHPDGSVTYEKLANLNYVTLQPLTSDPPLAPGRIWFRSDLGQLRYTPDGTTVYVIDPAPVVDKGWDDVSGHYFNTNPSYTSWAAYPLIQLNSPATGHKRSFEDAETGCNYVHGWLLKRNVSMSSRLDIVARVGAYHGYNATRANLQFVVLDDNNLDKRTRNDSYPWVNLGWTMSSLGYSNGSYGNPLNGYITFTDPPSYSFSPANPGVGYNRITEVFGRRMHILYGYADNWVADWNCWSSLQRGVGNTNLRYRVATEPPHIEVLRDLTKFLPVDLVVIARWDDEFRLWVKKGNLGFVMPLGKNVSIDSVSTQPKKTSPNAYDKIFGDMKMPEGSLVLEVRLKTDIRDRCRLSSLWRLVFIESDKGIHVAFGDSSWDGDKYGYYINVI